MSARKPYPRLDNATDVAPRHDFLVPGFSQLLVCHVEYVADGNVGIDYRGTMEELIGSGIATADMLVVNRATGPRVKRVDQGGFRFPLTRIWRSTDADGQECEPYRWFSLVRRRPMARLDELPYAREAIAAMKCYRDWQRRDYEARYEKRSPSLRLVVDNTRRQP